MSKKTQSQSTSRQTLTARSNFPMWGVIIAVVVVVVAVAIIALSQPQGGSPQALSPAATAAQSQPSGAAAKALPASITVADASTMRTAGAFILDVREPSEWVESHVPGSTQIPLGDLASRVSEVPKDKDVVVVCRSGNRSQKGRDILKQAGFNRVTSMAGGLVEWGNQNLPLVKGP